MLSLFFRSRLGTSDSLGILFSEKSFYGFHNLLCGNSWVKKSHLYSTPYTGEKNLKCIYCSCIMHSTIKQPTPTIKISTSQNLLLAFLYTMILSNFEQLQGQGNVIPVSVVRDYLGTLVLGGGQCSVGPARELQWISQSRFEDGATMLAASN